MDLSEMSDISSQVPSINIEQNSTFAELADISVSTNFSGGMDFTLVNKILIESPSKLTNVEFVQQAQGSNFSGLPKTVNNKTKSMWRGRKLYDTYGSTTSFVGKKHNERDIHDKNSLIVSPADESIENLNRYSKKIAKNKIIRRNKNEKPILVVKKPKIIKPSQNNIKFPNLRRSQRNRIMPLDESLLQKAIYKADENGLLTLIGVNEVKIKDPLFVKFNTTDFGLSLI